MLQYKPTGQRNIGCVKMLRDWALTMQTDRPKA